MAGRRTFASSAAREEYELDALDALGGRADAVESDVAGLQSGAWASDAWLPAGNVTLTTSFQDVIVGPSLTSDEEDGTADYYVTNSIRLLGTVTVYLTASAPGANTVTIRTLTRVTPFVGSPSEVFVADYVVPEGTGPVTFLLPRDNEGGMASSKHTFVVQAKKSGGASTDVAVAAKTVFGLMVRAV